jgi:hypothetical protein
VAQYDFIQFTVRDSHVDSWDDSTGAKGDGNKSVASRLNDLGAQGYDIAAVISGDSAPTSYRMWLRRQSPENVRTTPSGERVIIPSKT